MKLFACCSTYNLLITLEKIMPTEEKVDLLIGTQMPNYEILIPRVEKLPNIRRVYLYDSVSYKRIHYKNKIDKLLLHKGREIAYIESRLDIDWKQYCNQIYVYNDFEILGWYLVDKRIQYHLIEDGLNFFTYFHKYYNISADVYKGWKVSVKNLFNIGHRSFGASQYATDIEVNDLTGLEIPKKKVLVVQRKELMARLDDAQRKVLYDIFCQGKIIAHEKKTEKSLLLCTQPLNLDGQLKSMEEQQCLYLHIVKEYVQKGYQITVKPHPRDAVDYTELLSEFGCWVIDRFIPSEGKRC